jgi:hypothetical protein
VGKRTIMAANASLYTSRITGGPYPGTLCIQQIYLSSDATSRSVSTGVAYTNTEGAVVAAPIRSIGNGRDGGPTLSHRPSRPFIEAAYPLRR